jgi:hypothetical protein
LLPVLAVVEGVLDEGELFKSGVVLLLDVVTVYWRVLLGSLYLELLQVADQGEGTEEEEEGVYQHFYHPPVAFGVGDASVLPDYVCRLVCLFHLQSSTKEVVVMLYIVVALSVIISQSQFLANSILESDKSYSWLRVEIGVFRNCLKSVNFSFTLKNAVKVSVFDTGASLLEEVDDNRVSEG